MSKLNIELTPERLEWRGESLRQEWTISWIELTILAGIVAASWYILFELPLPLK